MTKKAEQAVEKLADLIVSPKDDKKDSKLTSIGIYVGTDKDHKKKSKQLSNLLEEHRSIQKTRDVYQKKNPKDFVTVAAKKEAPPSFWKFWKKDDYKKKTSSPKVYLSVGRAGGKAQKEFYNDVIKRRPYDPEYTKNMKKESAVKDFIEKAAGGTALDAGLSGVVPVVGPAIHGLATGDSTGDKVNQAIAQAAGSAGGAVSALGGISYLAFSRPKSQMVRRIGDKLIDNTLPVAIAGSMVGSAATNE